MSPHCLTQRKRHAMERSIVDRVTRLEQLLNAVGCDLIALAQDLGGDETTLRIRVKDVGERLVSNTAADGEN